MYIDYGDIILFFIDWRKWLNFVRIDSFKNGKLVLVGVWKLEVLIDNYLLKVMFDKVLCVWSKMLEIFVL